MLMFWGGGGGKGVPGLKKFPNKICPEWGLNPDCCGPTVYLHGHVQGAERGRRNANKNPNKHLPCALAA